MSWDIDCFLATESFDCLNNLLANKIQVLERVNDPALLWKLPASGVSLSVPQLRLSQEFTSPVSDPSCGLSASMAPDSLEGDSSPKLALLNCQLWAVARAVFRHGVTNTF
jgi:hypothetical protein